MQCYYTGQNVDRGSASVVKGQGYIVSPDDDSHEDDIQIVQSSKPSRTIHRKLITCPLCGAQLVGGQGSLTRHQRVSCPAKEYPSTEVARRRQSKSRETPANKLSGNSLKKKNLVNR